MSKATSRKKPKPDDLRPEYDLADLLREGIRGKYADEYRCGTNLVLLDPDIADEFEDDAAVNEALRLALRLANLPRGRKSKRAARQAVR